MDFKKIDREYRAIPFWSWNEKLDVKETRRQVKVMDEAGIGGYFMHARGGLLTEYMGKEWFDNVKATCEEGKARNMRSWAYDENGWPSGFGDGTVLALGEDYHQKALVYKRTEEFRGKAERVVLERGGYTYYYEVNDLYVDLLSPDVTDAFIKNVHEKYYELCGSEIEGFFTDEPQLLRMPGFPWSVITLPEFKKRYGYDLLDYIPSLFFEDENTARVRFDFWKMTTDLFSKNFFKKIYDWCEERGYKLTGHLVMEEVLEDIIPTNGAAMPHYEYFHIPGIDWLGRKIGNWLTPISLGSAAAQLGKKQVLSETFALTGHNVSHAELKRIYEWQMVRGINLLCPHLEGYSNRGIRKRDYPTAMYYQQPWWDDAKTFFDTMARIGMIIGEGRICADTLIINPVSTGWCMYDGFVENRDSAKRIRVVSDKFCNDLRKLEDKHVLYHLGDETLMERHAKVEGGKLVIGNMSYSNLIIPEGSVLFENTKRLIEEFKAAGGVITTVADVEPNPICEVNRLTYTKREFDDCTVHYFVNSNSFGITTKISKGDCVLNTETGELSQFSGEYAFAPYESLMVVEGKVQSALQPIKKEKERLSLMGEWEIKNSTLNSVTLDRCDYYFDGELVAKNGYVLDILPRLNAKRRPVALHQDYQFTVCEIPDGDIYLVTETPEIFDIKVNGTKIEKKDAGYFRDISFRKIPITGLIREGENTVEFDSVICQSEKTLSHIDKSWVCETMTNCLSYDIEIEPVYIAGNFGVKINAPIVELERGAYRVKELCFDGGASFGIVKAPQTVDISMLEFSGFPQFAGNITLKKKITVSNVNKSVWLCARGANSVHITVNGSYVGMRMFAPYEVDISEYLKVGENDIEIMLVNNLRNMQGPTHLKDGESYYAGRNVFYRESNVFLHKRGADDTCHDVAETWDDDVCLVHFGLLDSGYVLTEE